MTIASSDFVLSAAKKVKKNRLRYRYDFKKTNKKQTFLISAIYYISFSMDTFYCINCGKKKIKSLRGLSIHEQSCRPTEPKRRFNVEVKVLTGEHVGDLLQDPESWS